MADAPALGAGGGNTMEVQVLSPAPSSVSNEKTAPTSGAVLFSIHSSDARQTLLAQGTSYEEQVCAIQPDSRREFGISRMPRQIVGKCPAQPSNTRHAQRNHEKKRALIVSHHSLPTLKQLCLNIGLRGEVCTKGTSPKALRVKGTRLC